MLILTNIPEKILDKTLWRLGTSLEKVGVRDTPCLVFVAAISSPPPPPYNLRSYTHLLRKKERLIAGYSPYGSRAFTALAPYREKNRVLAVAS